MNDRIKKVMEAALKLFVAKGFQETSLQDILDAAGISKGTFYNYFKSKNECLKAIIEHTRDEAVLNRNEILMGKDPYDKDILLEQLTLLLDFYRGKNIHSIINSIDYTSDAELKKIILHHRLSELEWLAERFVDIFGQDIKYYSIECAIIYNGIVREMISVGRMIHSNNFDSAQVAKSAFKYVSQILTSLDKEKDVIFNLEKLVVLKNELEKRVVSKEAIEDKLMEFQKYMKRENISKNSIDLTNALYEEILAKSVRLSVIEVLLHPFYKSYKGTELHGQAQEIAIMTWNYLKNQK